MLRKEPSSRLRLEGLSLAGETSPGDGMLNSSQVFELPSLIGVVCLLDSGLQGVSLARPQMPAGERTQKRPGRR